MSSYSGTVRVTAGYAKVVNSRVTHSSGMQFVSLSDSATFPHRRSNVLIYFVQKYPEAGESVGSSEHRLSVPFYSPAQISTVVVHASLRFVRQPQAKSATPLPTMGLEIWHSE